MLGRLLLLASLWIWTVVGRSSSGSKVLVVLESKFKQSDYSLFFEGLEGRGYQLTFRSPKDFTPTATEDGIPNFDHVIIFAPSTKTLTADLTPQAIVDLLHQNVNVMIALGPTQTSLYSLGSEFGLIFPPPSTPLISHFTGGKPDIIPIAIPKGNPLLQLTPGDGKVLFKGIPHAFTTNPSIFHILHAPMESYASDSDFSSDRGADAIADSAEKGGEGLWAGSSLGVVSGFVTRNGARVLWAGGIEMFSNEFASSSDKEIVNAPFVQDLAAWTFQESLVIRVKNVDHHLESAFKAGVLNQTVPPMETYTTNDRITYSISLETFNLFANTWEPFSLPPGDSLQISYTMLDPHVRVPLSAVTGRPGTYSATFRAPDRHGVFKFAFSYLRKGYTPLTHEITTPLVPPRHDGYPRFLSAAWPYYAGAMSISAGFVIFSAVWLGGAGAREFDRGKKKNQ